MSLIVPAPQVDGPNRSRAKAIGIVLLVGSCRLAATLLPRGRGGNKITAPAALEKWGGGIDKNSEEYKIARFLFDDIQHVLCPGLCVFGVCAAAGCPALMEAGWSSLDSAEKVEVAPMLGVVAGYNWNFQITIDPPGYFNNRGMVIKAFASEEEVGSKSHFLVQAAYLLDPTENCTVGGSYTPDATGYFHYSGLSDPDEGGKERGLPDGSSPDGWWPDGSEGPSAYLEWAKQVLMG